MSRSHHLAVCLIAVLLIVSLTLVSDTAYHVQVEKDEFYNTLAISKQDTVKHGRSFFVENVGQLDSPQIRFYGKIPGGFLGFEDRCVRIRMFEEIKECVLSFPGSSPDEVIGRDPLDSPVNIISNETTVLSASQVHSIVYKDLWPGIDLSFDWDKKGIKYTFTVLPRANPNLIRMRFSDPEYISVYDDFVQVQFGKTAIIDSGLKILQSDREVAGRFIRKNSSCYGFEIEDYNPERVLVIDPLIYSTYVAGDEQDEAFSIATDASGSAYVCGLTWSYDFPVVNPIVDKYVGFHYDCFVYKLSPDGTELVYSTYITSGTGIRDLSDDTATAISVDSEMNAYIAGDTRAVDFPTNNSYDSTHNGGRSDCIVLKINATGNGLVYGTYLGGESEEFANDIAVDQEGCAYVTGFTTSSDFPVVKGYQQSIDPSGSCFITKFSPDGSSLVYSSFFGGSGVDMANAIAVDSTGSVCLAGQTTSDDLPVWIYPVTAYTGNGDAFLAKFSSDGSSLELSTYIGGSSMDSATSISVDADGALYLGGYTSSTDLPTVDAFDGSHNGQNDCFVLKMSSDQTIDYLTYVGGSSIEEVADLTTEDGRLYVTGHCYSTDFPVTQYYDTTHAGDSDCIVFVLSNNGKSLLVSTYVGGMNGDIPTSISIGPRSSFYITGYTFSEDFPTVNAFDHSFNSLPGMGWGSDTFVVRFYDFVDSDNDTMADAWEHDNGLIVGVNDTLDDPDSDGMNNIQEYSNFTDPHSNDSDSDQCPDLWEIINALNPVDPSDGTDDYDSDQLTNREEFFFSTNPNLNDSDYDLCPDGWEVEYGLDPLTNDSHLDPDSDGLSNLEEFEYGTYPIMYDSDNDSINDLLEIQNGCDPLVADYFCNIVPSLVITALVSCCLTIIGLVWRYRFRRSSHEPES